MGRRGAGKSSCVSSLWIRYNVDQKITTKLQELGRVYAHWPCWARGQFGAERREEQRRGGNHGGNPGEVRVRPEPRRTECS